MAWRIHLSDSAVYRLDVLPGSPTVVCAWTGSGRAACFDLHTGALLGLLMIHPVVAERGSDEWAAFLAGLRAPNGSGLPFVRLPNVTIRSTANEHHRLYDDAYGLTLWTDGSEIPLGGTDMQFVSVVMDQVRGVIAALDERGRLYLYQRQIALGVFDIGLEPEPGILPDIAMADSGSAVFASDGVRVVRVNGVGSVQQVYISPYSVGKIACSRDGSLFASSDPETGVIRLYDGKTFTFTHQKFAIDLYASANAVQLLADMPTPRIAVTALAVTNAGDVIFSLEGIVVVSHRSDMLVMPATQQIART